MKFITPKTSQNNTSLIVHFFYLLREFVKWSCPILNFSIYTMKSHKHDERRVAEANLW